MTLDCLIIGGGPAGLTAALYFARFRRSFLLVDAAASRARWIPTSHNLPFFGEGISGPDILRLQRAHAARYNAPIMSGTVVDLQPCDGFFSATLQDDTGGAGTRREVSARRVLLASGAEDIEPDLPNLPDAVRRGLVRYCPICDGYEAREQAIAVLGHGASGLGEAVFIARTYSHKVTLLTLGVPMELDASQREAVQAHGLSIVEQPVVALDTEDGRIGALTMQGGAQLRFDILYSALGLRYRTQLATGLGADHDAVGALHVDEHNQTSVKGLYAAGAIVKGLDQIVVAMGHAAIAATAIHNRCEIPTHEED